MRNIIIFLFCFMQLGLFAQAENKNIESGNKNYKNNDYAAAISDYENALQKNPSNQTANYNLGNALFGQQNFDDAIERYSGVAENTTDPAIRSQAFHNLGNAQLMKKEYEKSIDAYKKALRSNPNDLDTKYNLAYAQKKLEQQQKQQQQNKDQNQKNQDQQNKDDKSQDEKNQDQQNKDEQQQNNQNQQQDKAQQQPKKYSKEDMDRIMQALNNEDKKTQDKLNKQKMTPQKITIDKDW